MKYVVAQRIICGLAIDGKQLEIDGCIFLPDFEGDQIARRIQTEVEANTQEEAQREAHKLFAQLLSKLTLLCNSKYTQLDSFSVSVTHGHITTASISFPTSASLSMDLNLIKDNYMKNMKDKHVQIEPVQFYANGINSSDPFDQFRNFYRVLEYYFRTENPKNWIQGKWPNIELINEKDTIITSIRHRLSHGYTKGASEPLSISNPEDVLLVQKHLPIVQNLAREIIREKEKI